MNNFFLIILICGVTVSESSFAFKADDYSIGVGYYSQNVFNKTAQDEGGKTKLLGEPNYPVNFKYDFSISPSWYLAPQLSYTLLPRSNPGSGSKVTLMHLSFLFGQNFSSSASTWDWYLGPGYLNESIKGSGGTTVLDNGTGTATFALPGATANIRKLTANLGSSWTTGSFRFAADLIFENAFSSSKRSQSLMISSAYSFGGGH